jgi:hypothetical protein
LGGDKKRNKKKETGNKVEKMKITNIKDVSVFFVV